MGKKNLKKKKKLEKKIGNCFQGRGYPGNSVTSGPPLKNYWKIYWEKKIWGPLPRKNIGKKFEKNSAPPEVTLEVPSELSLEGTPPPPQRTPGTQNSGTPPQPRE